MVRFGQALRLILLSCLTQVGIPASFGSEAASTSEPDLSLLQVPSDFTIELAADSSLVQFPMCAAFDERGRLFVTESSGKNVSGKAMAETPECRISVLEDTDDDGVFDKSTVFADRLSLPMGALWYQGSLYVASPPDFIRLDDSDGDGVSDQREVILTGWNVLNTASLHGPFLGPDGWMYLTHGRHGYKIETKEGETLEGLAPRLWRCRPDGTGLERVCGGGFDNPVELIFTPAGEMIITMTYFTDPRNGQRDALLHLVEGGVYSKPHECVREFKRTGDFMPVMTKFARIAPAGLMMLRGDAFGPDYKGSLFSAQFNPHRIQRHKLFRDGATFRTEDEDFLVSSDPDFHPTDAIEDADGSLLVLDTGGWYVDACPLSKISKPDMRGAIYRIHRTGAQRHADPRGASIDFSRRSPRELAKLLEDDRPAVRDQAAEFLQKQGDEAVSSLARVRKRSKIPEARFAALWTLARIGNRKALEEVRAALADDEAEMRVAAACALGRLGDTKSFGKLERMAIKDEPPVRREAATALGRLGDRRAGESLLKAAANADDRFIEHAIIYSLIALGNAEAAEGALQSREPRTRKAALIALDQMDGSPLERGRIAPLIRDADEDVRRAALWVVSHHPDWAGEVVDYLRGAILNPNLSDDQSASVREALIAFAAADEIQRLVPELLAERSLDPPRRNLLMDAMERCSLKELPANWIAAVGNELESDDTPVRWRAIALIRSRGIPELDSALNGIVGNPDEPPDLRIAALSARLSHDPKLSDAEFALLVAHLSGDSEAALRLSVAQALARAKPSDEQLIELARGSVAVADPLILSPLLEAFRESRDSQVGGALVQALIRSASSANFLGGGRLEKLLASFPPRVRVSAAPLARRIEEAEEERLARLEEFEPLLSGGDVGRGRRIFYDKKAACSSCHAIGNEGGNLGPDLTSIGQIRSGRDILEALLFPNATIVPGYEPVRVETASQTLAGILGDQTSEAVLLKTGADAEIRLARENIRSIEPSTVSVMPEGLDTGLTKPELLDLLAFLQAQNGEQWLSSQPRQAQRIPLFNGRDLAGFYRYLRDFGIDNDPDQVFSVQDGLLRISGQHYGYLGTKTEARNYRLAVEFKWGDETWAPRKANARDSGILLHMSGEDKIWPTSIECQIIEGGTGDIIVIPEAKLTVGGETKASGRFDRPGRNPWEDKIGFRGPNELENPHGEWNTIEIVCDEDKIRISVNGRLTLEGAKAEPKGGRILFQSEGAEIFLRRIDLYPLK